MMLGSVWSWIAGLLGQIIDAVTGSGPWLKEQLVDGIAWLAKSFGVWVMDSVPYIMNGLLDFLTTLGVQWDRAQLQTAWDGIWPWVASISWVLPMGTVLGIMASVFIVRMMIRGVRLVLGLIPTIHG